MKRHIKKHLKELKRRNKTKVNPKTSPKNRYWPAIYCLKEKVFIGVSNETMKVKKGRPKLRVGYKEWDSIIGRFRSELYRIDMTKFKDGDLVQCPFCGGRVDFRSWVSATKPEFI